MNCTSYLYIGIFEPILGLLYCYLWVIQDKLTGEVPVLGSYQEILILEVSAGIRTSVHVDRSQ
jgi:hypothetical protein